MAETIIINQQSPSNSNQSGSSRLFGLFANLITLFLIIAVIAVGFAIYYFIDNWNYIAAFFTTGLIGFLNPFDDPDGDLQVWTGLQFIPGPVGLISRLLK